MNRLQEEFELMLVYSQDYPFEVDTTNLLNQWRTAKQNFLKRMNGETIIRSKQPVKIYLSDEQKAQRFKDFLATLDDNNILTPDLEDFLYQNEAGFFDNRVLVECSEKGVQPGAKISKSLKRFLVDDDTVRNAQDIASRFIQENKIEGYLYLSVDPRDFLTLSENNEHWWSCQSLDGDHRAGNLSYMVDDTTIIAYLASAEPQHLKCTCAGQTWNSKKWRMLVHTNWDGAIYYNRQYPYVSTELVDLVHQMTVDLLFKDGPEFCAPGRFGFKVPGNELVGDNFLYAGQRAFSCKDIIHADDYLGYCDLINSATYEPIVAIALSKMENYVDKHLFYENEYKQEYNDFHDMFGITIGHSPICPCCGSEVIERHDSFLCPLCIAENDADEDFFLTCNICNHKIHDDEQVFRVGDYYCCKHCYKEELAVASIDEEE